MASVLRLLFNIVIASAVVALALPLLAMWLGTRRRGVATALRAVVAGGLVLLGLANGAVPVLIGGILVMLWPRRLVVGGRRRSLAPSSRVRRVESGAVHGEWGRLLRQALAARAQFDAAIRRAPDGVVRAQLRDLVASVDAAVSSADEVARRGAELERAAADLGVRAGRRGPFRGGDRHRTPPDPRVVEAVRARDAASARLATAIGKERAELHVLVARLGQAACSAAELASYAASTPVAPGPGSHRDSTEDLLDRLEALRGALAEVASA